RRHHVQDRQAPDGERQAGRRSAGPHLEHRDGAGMSAPTRMLRAAIGILFASLCPAALLAQDPCPHTMTVADCFDLLPKGAAQPAAADAVRTKPAGKATGTPTSFTPGSAINDFLPLMRLAVGAASQPSANDRTALDFERKLPLPAGSPAPAAVRG